VDYGVNWTEINVGIVGTAQQFVSSGVNLYARTYGGFFWSPVNGDYWIAINSGITKPSGASSGALSVDGNVMYASTKDPDETGKTYKSINGGMAWTEIPAMTSYYVQALLNTGSNVFAGNIGNYGMSSNGGGVVRSTDDGITWAPASVGLSGISCNAIASNGTDIFAGTRYYSGIFKSTDNGSNWTKTTLPGTTTNYQVLSMMNVGSIVYAGNNTSPSSGGVFKSTDNGQTWTATGTIGKPVYALGANTTYIYAGTSNDGMRRSSNGGTTWTTINSGLPSIGEKSIRAMSVNGSTIHIGNSRGVFISTNDGTNWAAANGGLGSPGYISVRTLVVKGDTIVAGSYAGIIRSTNKGVTWSSITSAYGNINALLLDGATIYVGSSLGVFVSNDWGDTWNSLNATFQSIPEVYSLYKLNNKLFAGTYGQSVWQYPLAQAPSTFAVTGGGNYCAAGSGLPVGLAGSEPGVTYILYKDNVAQVPTVPGTGSAITFGNQTAGMYTVSGTNSTGTTPMTGSAVITETTPLAVSVSISADVNPVPEGSTATLTAVAVNGGSTPVYQWLVNGTFAGTDNPVFAYIPVNQDAITCTLTSGETCTTGNPATSNVVVLAVIPDTVNLQNIVVSNGDTNCYDAIQTIFVAGEGVTFTVEAGGSATMIAGQNILYLPGTTVEPGGYLNGYISTVFCTNLVNPATGNPVQAEVKQVSVQEFIRHHNIRIYPNPAGSQFTLELQGTETAGIQKLEIYTLAGVKVAEQDCAGSRRQTVSVVDLAPGVYVVKVMAGGEWITMKSIKM
jgi:hypothetical protein